MLSRDPPRHRTSPRLILVINVGEMIAIGAGDLEALVVLNKLEGCAKGARSVRHVLIMFMPLAKSTRLLTGLPSRRESG
jgi:hypothetical protein